MNPATELLDSVLDDQVETITVAVGEEDWFTGIAAKNDVIKCAGKMDALLTGHGRAENARMSSLTP